MNHIRTILVASMVALGSIAALVIPAGSATAATTNCTGWSTSTLSGPIVVPDGSTCWVRNTDSVTDITVNPKGTLVLYFAKVDSVRAYGAVQSWMSTVRNSTILSDISNGPSAICGSTFGGGLTILRVSASVDVRPLVGGGTFCQQSNAISGNLKMQGNTGPLTVDSTSVVDYCFGTGNTALTIRALTTLDGERRQQCA